MCLSRCRRALAAAEPNVPDSPVPGPVARRRVAQEANAYGPGSGADTFPVPVRVSSAHHPVLSGGSGKLVVG